MENFSKVKLVDTTNVDMRKHISNIGTLFVLPSKEKKYTCMFLSDEGDYIRFDTLVSIIEPPGQVIIKTINSVYYFQMEA